MQNIIEWEGLADERGKGMVFSLYEEIFSTPVSKKVVDRLTQQEGLLILIAVDEAENPMGFKVGYRASASVFYSWIGGVLPPYRGRGIAQALMKRQHEWCVKQGYAVVQTKTMNRWREMLLLNIRWGFNIVNAYRDSDGEVKIVLEYDLTKPY